MNFSSFSDDTAVGLGVKEVDDFMCIKMAGHDKDTPSRSVFYRQCAVQTAEDVPNVNGQCTETTQDLILKGFGTIAAGAKQFVCTSDKCNDGTLLDTFCGSQRSDSGEASLRSLSSLGTIVLVTALAKLVGF